MTKIGISQNGYDVFDNTNNFVRTRVEGVGFWSLDADVATILDDFTQKFHDTIEKITLPVSESPGMDDWSYAVRPVRGQTTGYSNHGSATARDLNATRHPRGVRNTYNAEQRKKLKALVDSYDGVLRHGEFYTGTIDGMHVEIDCNRAKIIAMAKKIRDRNKPEEFVVASAKDVENAVKKGFLDLLDDKDFTNKLAEKLFNADVIAAPAADLKRDPKNVNWQMGSFLRRLVGNTASPEPTPTPTPATPTKK